MFVFAMGRIQTIGHDHQAPFWHLLLLANQAVTKGKNKLPHAHCTIHLGTPRLFTDFEPTISVFEIIGKSHYRGKKNATFKLRHIVTECDKIKHPVDFFFAFS